MDAILEALSRGVEQLLGRASGPLHLRLVITPTVATILAIRAGLKDAREGQPPFLWQVLTNPAQRQMLLHSGWKDIGKMVIVAFVFDTVYQLFVLRAFYVVQALILVVVLAIVPYVLIRGTSTRLARGLYKKQAGPVNLSAAKTTEDTEGR
jgi:uncharacterized membrane protein